jgi:tetratricopeptide (TPR) repeat protein
MIIKNLYHITFIIAVILVAVSPVFLDVVLAADDGGGRSVFAFGAGNRALGLGGAYASLADDASALLWNPGGLGLVERTELQFSQTSYYGFGMNEQYGSLVLPHWKLGTASITFRRFAVGGIERRDDRNVLLEDDLSNNETEFLIGYGRNISSVWNVGAAVKIRRHSLAGYSGSGVGVDAGILTFPLEFLYPNMSYARRLSLGLSVRNAVEPKIRLEDEYVPDPVGIRLGAAYWMPFFQNRTLLAAIDLEKTSDMNTRLHAGFELGIHPLLTLRMGVNDGTLTAGTGIQWKGVTIDYTFEDNPIDLVHRVGASFAFGPTVEQSRLAALEAEENAIQAKLAAAFEARQNERINDLLTQAEEARRRSDFDYALDLLALVTALEPNNEEALSRQAVCFRELGKQLEFEGDFSSASVNYSRSLAISPDDKNAREGYERCRAQSDLLAARSIEIRRMFEAAMDAFSANKLSEARDGFVEILKVSPGDRDAGAMLQRTLRAIDYRVADLLQQANRMIEWGHYDEVEWRISEVTDLDPNAAGLEDTAKRFEQAKSDYARVQQQGNRESEGDSAHPSPGGRETGIEQNTGASVLSEDQKREVEHLYKRGMSALSEGNTQEAMKYLELVWSKDPGYQRVSDHLKREYLNRGMEYFADGYLEEAVELWEKALRLDPTDRRIIGYLSRAREQIARTRDILGKSR